MADNGRPPLRPMMTLPPPSRGSVDSLFGGGPMAMVSSFFAENDPDTDFRSFSQLLAGAVSSPSELHAQQQGTGTGTETEADGGEFRFQQKRPMGLVVPLPQNQMPAAGMFTVPPGLSLSPTCFIDSPAAAFFSSAQDTFGMAHQQVLAQIPAQSQMHIQSAYSSLLASSPASLFLHQQLPPLQQQILPPMLDSSDKRESSDVSHSDQKPQPSNVVIDKPTDDGYNWRKYGQKQVKGSEYPRGYYKCTSQNCPVKKKVERTFDGQITEIIYKGQHNHPAPSKRSKDTGNPTSALDSNLHTGNNKPREGVPYSDNPEYSQNMPGHVSGSSDSEEVCNVELRVSGRRDHLDLDEPESKRRNIEVQASEQTLSHRTVMEPRIVVQTTSEIDLLDDGYRWRKYGQKVVKGNPHPRSYYKCTYPGCNVRKHVERAASDLKAVITTYEGKHTHDVPAAKSGSHSIVQLRARNPLNDRPTSNSIMEFENSEPQPISLIRFKEERIP